VAVERPLRDASGGGYIGEGQRFASLDNLGDAAEDPLPHQLRTRI
jgi:hypothetical protein